MIYPCWVDLIVIFSRLIPASIYLLKVNNKTMRNRKRKKCDGTFILTFVVAKVTYEGITTANILVKNLLFLVVYQRRNDAL